jgi:hypothetical protein
MKESSNFLQKSGILLIFLSAYLRVLPPVEKGVKFYALLGLTDRLCPYIAIVQNLFVPFYDSFFVSGKSTRHSGFGPFIEMPHHSGENCIARRV